MSMTLSSYSLPTLRVSPRLSVRWSLRVALLWLCFCAVVGAGISLRRWVWDHTTDMRFRADLDNGFHRGLEVNQAEQKDLTRPPEWNEFFTGFRDIYAAEDAHHTGGMPFDYSPLRLLVMSLWVRGILSVDPNAAGWIDRDAGPLLWFNTLCALASAIGVYALIRQWLTRRAKAHPAAPPRAIEARAWAAGMCLWFNPAILLDAHVWPQWDVWCLPFYVWAVFAGSAGAWFWAGALVALGAMFKGQILIVAGVLIIWCILSGGIKQTALAILGMLTVGVLIGGVWLLPTVSAWALIGMAITLCTLAGLLLSKRLRNFWLYYLAALLCVGLMAGGWYFGGSLLWLRTSFVGAAQNFRYLHIDAINFPSVLNQHWGWQIDDPVFTTGSHVITINSLLRGIYFVVLILCGIAAAVQTRRKSPRALLAVITPWIVMYAILPQMHERYLMWGAALAAIGVGISLELSILFLLTTAMACASILIPIYHAHAAVVIDRLDPDLGWVILLVAAAYFYQIWKRDEAFF